MLRRFTLFAGLIAASASLARAQTASVEVPAQSEGGTAATVAAATAAPTIYFTAEEMPAFPGGDAALVKFLSSKVQYPAAALDRSLSGKVHVSFTVDPAGHLHDPRVVRGLGNGLDEEALRLVRLMPWWTPGRVHGQPVWVSVTMPIVFRAL
ncbi:protein TonB [Hymenobacter sp. UYAg731]